MRAKRVDAAIRIGFMRMRLDRRILWNVERRHQEYLKRRSSPAKLVTAF